MDFFKKRIKQYQEKKLEEIVSKIQFHQYMKKQAEAKLESNAYDKTKTQEEITFNENMVEIWQRREDKLRRQMSEIYDEERDKNKFE